MCIARLSFTGMASRQALRTKLFAQCGAGLTRRRSFRLLFRTANLPTPLLAGRYRSDQSSEFHRSIRRSLSVFRRIRKIDRLGFDPEFYCRMLPGSFSASATVVYASTVLSYRCNSCLFIVYMSVLHSSCKHNHSGVAKVDSVARQVLTREQCNITIRSYSAMK